MESFWKRASGNRETLAESVQTKIFSSWDVNTDEYNQSGDLKVAQERWVGEGSLDRKTLEHVLTLRPPGHVLR